MKETVTLLFHLLTTIARLLGPGGARAIVAENLLLKHQLIVHSRSRHRAPNLSTQDRALLGFWTLFLNPRRILRASIILKPSTLLKFHAAMKKRKYSLLYSARKKGKPGPKGPSNEVIDAIVAMKQRNPQFGCPRIAEQINSAFGLNIDKDIVRRVLAKHYQPYPGDNGPSWLTILGHAKDSLWSIDFFRCESILLKSHWVLLVMDQFTRRIIGFSVHAGDIDGPTLCRLFNSIIAKQELPRYLSSDNDPIFRFQRWRANLRILDIEEIKSVPYTPISHPYVERMIGSVRRELLDQTFFWNDQDLARKLESYQQYYNLHRTHSSLKGQTPFEGADKTQGNIIDVKNYRWQPHCQGLFQLPIAALLSVTTN